MATGCSNPNYSDSTGCGTAGTADWSNPCAAQLTDKEKIETAYPDVPWEGFPEIFDPETGDPLYPIDGEQWQLRCLANDTGGDQVSRWRTLDGDLILQTALTTHDNLYSCIAAGWNLARIQRREVYPQAGGGTYDITIAKDGDFIPGTEGCQCTSNVGCPGWETAWQKTVWSWLYMPEAFFTTPDTVYRFKKTGYARIGYYPTCGADYAEIQYTCTKL